MRGALVNRGREPEGMRVDVPLAPLTTLELGGAARFLVEASSVDELVAVLEWAAPRSLPVALLGGGSNLVVSDEGFPGLVVRVGIAGLDVDRRGGEVVLRVGAGEVWDDVAERAVDRGWAGIECLSGIPGSAGATPIQNVGAYGQEVADVVRRVRVLDRWTSAVRELEAGACAFAYRSSRFKAEPGRFVVLEVELGLRAGGRPTILYPELEREVGAGADLVAVRRAVLRLRRRKSMVLDVGDTNRRSVGSFFLNPVLGAAQLARLEARLAGAGPGIAPRDMPRFPAPGGEVKVSAAWLIEHSGFARGLRRGPVGISSRHTLALVHHGGGTTRQLLALAAEIRAGVAERFGVVLRPEPTFLGFPGGDPLSSVSA